MKFVRLINLNYFHRSHRSVRIESLSFQSFIFVFLVCVVLSYQNQAVAQSLPGFGNLGGLMKPKEPQKKDSNQNSQGGNPGQGSQNPAALMGGMIGLATSSQSTEEELQVGDGVAAMVLGAAPLASNQKTTTYINLVGRAIVQHSERKDLPWRFGLLETSAINAFAAPGGIILITRGLYDLLETEDELAAVLAHEIAHVNKQHHYNIIKQQKIVQMGTNFMQSQMSKGNNELANRLVGIGAELMARGLDKESEFEADRDGVVLAARAGYDSSGLLSVLGKLHARAKSDGALQLLFKTHPSPSERIERLSAVINPEIEAAAMPSAASSRIQSQGR
jgi:predicted Zn-dependent protease